MTEVIAVPVRPWEKVHTINDHYGLWPLEGLADLDGIPHFYACQFDEEQDDWSEVFLLTPADPALVALKMEMWAIWLRWKAAFDRGQETTATHPALEHERERYDALKAAMGDNWRPQPERSRRMKGKFRDTRGPEPSVQWTPVE